MRSVFGISVLTLLALACGPRESHRSPAPQLDPGESATLEPAETQPEGVAYRMSPVLEGDVLTALAIELRFGGDASGVTRLQLPEEWASERELWRYVRELEIEGARTIEDDGPALRVIHAEPGAPLVVRYRVVSAYDREPSTSDGQPFAPIVRPDWFYAFGEALFAAPEERDDSPASFAWVDAPPDFAFASDLEQLAEGGASVGDVRESISMGGAGTKLYTAHIGDAPIHVGIRGDYGFTDAVFVEMARSILAAERELWNEHGEPFTIVLAPLVPVPRRRSLGGTGRSDAFALTVSQDSPIEPLRHLIAHEYFHTWNPRRLGGSPEGEGEMTGKWFSEGFTELYTWRLLLRSGLYQLEDFVADWNAALLEYATSPVRNEPNARIVADYWNDPDVGKLPYRRGPLLGVIWDRRLREATGGARGLDDVLHAMRADMVVQADSELVADAAVRFPAAYVAQGGPDLQPDLERFIERGETIILPADVFGGCIRVVTRPAQAPGEAAVQQLEIVGATTPAERAACVRTVAGLSP